MLLYIVRHAWAEDRDETRWPDDSLRPLTEDGQLRFAKMLKRLADAKFWPGVIATSPLVRCVQTAELIAKRVKNRPKIEHLPALAPGSNLQSLVEWTAQHADSDVAWVGHAPDVEHLASELIGNGDAAIHFKKGAIVAIRFDGPVELRRGELQWLATAKLLGV
jgi:phosphohistidine phosphatase